MEHSKKPTDECLLDFHLDRLDGAARSWMEAELERDHELRKRSERLGRVLQPLDHWRPAPGPANLADKVLSHVRAAARDAAPIPFESVRGPSRRFREFAAVAACLVLLIGLGVPGMAAVRDRAQRTMCAGNLESIFKGAASYQQAFGDSLPYAGPLVRASWLPTGESGMPFASNSRHPYLLIKLKYGPRAADFRCPGRCNGEPSADEPAEAGDDFLSENDISYDSLNLAGESPNVRPPTSLAYVSDANPLFVGARFHADVDPGKANSPAHRGRGQTVLRLDGSARFTRTPVYCSSGDNLWTISNVRTYRGTESPTRPDDAFLVPGYPQK
jgi:hypothetical protein